jgi:acyl carrier protein
VEEVAFKKVHINDELILSGILDSMSVIELISEIEEFYSIRLSLAELKVNKVSTIYEFSVFIKGFIK